MAYLPYRMYGNGNFQLPIVDIVQTVNSPTQVCRKPKIIVVSSSKGLHNFKTELDLRKRRTTTTGKQLRGFHKRHAVSCNYMPRYGNPRKGANFVRTNFYKPKRPPLSRKKILRIRRLAPLQNGIKYVGWNNCQNTDVCLGEKKSLKVLFRAKRTNGLLENDSSIDGEEFYFPAFRTSPISSINLKRKASFADYIRAKRKKEYESQHEHEFDFSSKYTPYSHLPRETRLDMRKINPRQDPVQLYCE